MSPTRFVDDLRDVIGAWVVGFGLAVMSDRASASFLDLMMADEPWDQP